MTGPRDDGGTAGVVAAVLLFGILVSAMALLNVVAVPQAGLRAEEEHYGDALDALGAVAALAESTAAPGLEGATGARAFPLGPPQRSGQGALDFFLATPARAAGELRLDPGYGNLTLAHYRAGDPAPVVDVGSPAARFPLGRLAFDPHPVFRPEGTLSLEGGAVVTHEGDRGVLRSAPPVSLSLDGSTLRLSVKARVLTGPAQNLGGSSTVQVGLQAEAATLHAPAAAGAERVVLRLETAHGPAWGARLNETGQAAGLASGSGYATLVERGAGEGGLDVVTWTVHGVGTGNDIRLTTGVSVHAVRIS